MQRSASASRTATGGGWGGMGGEGGWGGSTDFQLKTFVYAFDFVKARRIKISPDDPHPSEIHNISNIGCINAGVAIKGQFISLFLTSSS